MTSIIHTGDAVEVLRALPAASVNCCVTSPLRHADLVKLVGELVALLHRFAEDSKARRRSDMATTGSDARPLALFLHVPQSEAFFCLLTLDAKEWQNRAQQDTGLDVGGLPNIEASALFGGWRGEVPSSAEVLVDEIHGVRLYLLHANALAVTGLLRVPCLADAISRPLYADRHIRIDDANVRKNGIFRGWKNNKRAAR